jgi:hypothetical protein
MPISIHIRNTHKGVKMSGEAAFVKGSMMGRKISMLIISTLITLFFLAMSIYQLEKAFSTLGAGDVFTGTQIAGWISVILFFLGIWCIVLIFKSDTSPS